MKQRKKSFGMRISAFVLSFAMVCTLLAGVNVVAFAADDDLSDTVSVQKFYYDVDKGGNGEHIYTIDEDEISWYKSLPSWNDEGEAWKAPLFSEVPVYRVANYNTGEHLWITDKGYVDYLVGIGWTQEQGVAFYSDENEGVPVYRLWDGTGRVGSHHYSTDAGEIAWLVSIGWQNEGPQFYGVKGEEPTTKALSAAQVGSDKIMVSSEDGFTGEESFTVSHGDLVDELAGVEYDEDLDIYTITLANPIEDATYTVSCDGYTPATFEGEESEKVMFAIQTGADEITVTSEVPFEEGVEFEVSHGLVDDTVIDYVFDDDRCTVQLYLEDDIVDATYTVECSDEEYDAVEFDCKAAVLTTVEIDEDLIDMGGNKYNVSIDTRDQFGDPFYVNKWDADLYSSDGATGNWDGEKGILTITNANAEVGAKETIILVKDELVTQGVATYSISSIPTLVAVSDTIQMTPAEAQKNQTGRIDVDDLTQVDDGYYFDVDVIDQYGQPMTDATVLNNMVKGDYLVVTGNGVIEPADADDPFSDDGEGNVFMFIKKTTTNTGLGTINILPVTNPTGADKAEVTVSANESLATLTVSKALNNLRIGADVAVAVSATNNYGEAVDISKEILNVTGTDNVSFDYKGGSDNSQTVANAGSMKLVNATMGYVLATEETPAFFTVNADKSNVIVFATTTTQQKQFDFTAEDAATPTGIYGLRPLLVDTVVWDNTADKDAETGINNNAVILKDQYGEKMATACAFKGLATGINADADANSYVYTIAKKGNLTATTPSAINGIDYSDADINKGEKSVKDTYTITAWKVGETKIDSGKPINDNNAKKLGSTEFSVTVAAKTFVSYSAALAKDEALYTGVTSGDDSANANQILLFGTTADGVTVPLEFDGVNTTATFRGTTSPLTVGTVGKLTLANNGAITVTTVTTEDPGKINGIVPIDIYANGNLIDTVELAYSNDTPEAQDIICLDKTEVPYDLSNGFKVKSNTQGGYTADLTTEKTIKIGLASAADGSSGITAADYVISVVDQYGLTKQVNVVATFGGDLLVDNADKTTVFGKTGTLMIMSGNLTEIVPITVPAAT